MTPEQKQIMREVEIESAWFFFYAKYKNQIADCDANSIMLEAELEARLLPISIDSLSEVWESLSLQQKKAYAQPNGVLKAHKQEEPPTVSTNAILDKIGFLPAEYTRRRILDMNAAEFKALKKQFGNQAVEDRVNGRDSNE